MSVSPNVVIMTIQELDDLKQAQFKKGVERGRYEERMAPVERRAYGCANWKEGRCETCGAQSQYHEVDAMFKCPNWVKRP